MLVIVSALNEYQMLMNCLTLLLHPPDPLKKLLNDRHDVRKAA
jgi:hypothetical protein